MSKFQIIIIAIFAIFIIVGVAAFALYRGGSQSNQLPAVTIWGTFPADTFNQYVAKINNTLAQPVTIRYQQESPSSFSQDFIAALARGQGPDAILIPADMILPHEDKLALVPYSVVPQRTFLDTYIQEAGIYLAQNGALALPFMVDPLVMYWNRDMFDAAGIATYPRYWDEFTAKGGLIDKLTQKDQNGNVRKSALALGDFSTVDNAREIFGTLLMQTGNPVTVQDNAGLVTSAIKLSAPANPQAALQFFTQFVDPNAAAYSWNRSLPDSKAAFLSGMLATYFGFASELKDIRAKNPNLNFDAAALPQIRPDPSKGQPVKAVYGRMYGLSLVRASANVNAAYQIISMLTAPQYLADLSNTLYLPNVRRDVIGQGTTDPYIKIFDDAALVSRTWLDAGPDQSRQIFGAMVQSVTNGQKNINQAIQDAGDQYDVVLRQAIQ